MGHTGSSSRAAQEILSLLRRALPRYLLQHHPPSKNVVLHGELDRAMREHLVFVGARVLLARGLGRKDRPLHQHPTIPNHVLPLNIGDYTIDLVGVAFARQILVVHHDPRRSLGSYNDRYIERSLS